MKFKLIWLSNEILFISILAINLSKIVTKKLLFIIICETSRSSQCPRHSIPEPFEPQNFVIGLNSNKQATVFEDRATLSQLEFALGHFTATVSFVTSSDCEKRFEC